MVSQYNHIDDHHNTCVHMFYYTTQIILFMEIEDMKRIFLSLSNFCCHILKKPLGQERVDGVEMTCFNTEKSATKSDGPSFDSITPRSRTKVLGSILGIDNIDYILSDFEEVTVCTLHVHCLQGN